MEKFKWPKDWKKHPALVRAKAEMDMINALDLDVPRTLLPNLEQTEGGKQQQALRAFTMISTAHAGRAAGSEWVDYQSRPRIRRSLVNAESEELTCRRIAMLKEDQKKLKAKKDEEEALQLCSGTMLDIQAAGEKAHEQIQVTD